MTILTRPPLLLLLALLAGCAASRTQTNADADTTRTLDTARVVTPTGAASKVWFDPAVWVISDTARYVDRVIEVKVHGPDPVVIAEARPSCGCILATVLRNRATEREPGRIRVAVDMKKMPPGATYEILVTTNSIVTPAISMEIRRAGE